jgi:PAS domain-containing protein
MVLVSNIDDLDRAGSPNSSPGVDIPAVGRPRPVDARKWACWPARRFTMTAAVRELNGVKERTRACSPGGVLARLLGGGLAISSGSSKMGVMRRFDTPLRIPRATVAATAIAAFGCIFAFRLLTDDAAEPVMFLMVVPISLLAAEFGLTSGIVAAGVASALVAAWALIGNPVVSAFGYSARVLIFFLTGLTVGFLSSSRKQIETESSRWFEQSADLNCVADFGGNLVRVNRAFEEILGHSAREILSRPYAAFVHRTTATRLPRSPGCWSTDKRSLSGSRTDTGPRMVPIAGSDGPPPLIRRGNSSTRRLVT